MHQQDGKNPEANGVILRRRGLHAGVTSFMSTVPSANTTAMKNSIIIWESSASASAPALDALEVDEGSKISHWISRSSISHRGENNEHCSQGRSMSVPVTPTLTAAAGTTATQQPTAAVGKQEHRLTTAKRSVSESSADEFQRSIRRAHKGKMWRNELVVHPGSTSAQPQRKHSTGADAAGPEKLNISNALDVAVRVIMVIIFVLIQLEELWLYRYPRMPDIVTPQALLLSVILGPFCTTFFHLLLKRDRRDFRAATWAWTLALGMNGIITSMLKVTVGRPRPDLFYRCYPDGVMVVNNASDGFMFHGTLNLHNCTGDPHDINEGFKSFPSGHSSFAFCAFSFITFYVGGKLHAFAPLGRGQSWRFCIASTPLILALLVAISRTCDYHHHWQDVVVGSIIGFSVTYYVYRQYYPSVFSRNAHRSYSRECHSSGRRGNTYTRLPAESTDVYAATTTPDEQQLLDSDEEDCNIKSPAGERSPLISEAKRNNKWI